MTTNIPTITRQFFLAEIARVHDAKLPVGAVYLGRKQIDDIATFEQQADDPTVAWPLVVEGYPVYLVEVPDFFCVAPRLAPTPHEVWREAYAYPTVEDYEAIVGYKLGDGARSAWDMARAKNRNFLPEPDNQER